MKIIVLSILFTTMTFGELPNYQFRIEQNNRRIKISSSSKDTRYASFPKIGLHPNTEDWKIAQTCRDLALITADDVGHKLFVIDASDPKPEFKQMEYPEDYEGQDGQSGDWREIKFNNGCNSFNADIFDYGPISFDVKKWIYTRLPHSSN